MRDLSSRSSGAAPGQRGLNQLLGLGFGLVYVLVGLAGFLVTGTNFAGRRGDSLLGFDVTILHNLVHLAIGIVLVTASRTLAGAPAVNLAMGAAYLLLGLLGSLVNDTPLDVLGLNGADHVLHLASGLLLLGVGLVADNRGVTTGGGGSRSAAGPRSGRATAIGGMDTRRSGSHRL